MFTVSIEGLIDQLDKGSAHIPRKYDALIDFIALDDPQMHPVYARLMESLAVDRRNAKAEARLLSYYQLAALELVAKVVLGLPVERLPLGHERFAEVVAPSALALVWAAQFLAYCDGKEPFSIYNSEGSRVWSITDDNVEGQDFVEFFKIEA